jgi:uncharacterized protein YjbJ (UPF0337 family)
MTPFKEKVMNWDTVKGDWKQFKGKVKEQWGKLTDEDLNRIEGCRDQLAGAIQQRYGIEKDEAERQVGAFEEKCGQAHEGENRIGTQAGGREVHEKNVAGQRAMNNPNMDRPEGAAQRHDPRRQDEQTVQSSDPNFHKQQGDSGERMKDKDVSGEKKMEGKQPTAGQKQHSQAPRPKK